MKEIIKQEAADLQDELVHCRRWLHAHAETGFALERTKPYVRSALEEMGLTVQDCGKAGLVASIGSGEKCLLLRADMDALPIREAAEVPFRCESGTMHACGHDMHTTMLLGAAKILKKYENQLCGTVKLMFQPAEEIFEGAADMIANGVLENPRPDAALMIHVTAGVPIPAGTLIVTSPGISAPAADYFTIRVQGRGCHGSAPQNGVDPITAAAHILIGLQEITARELASTDEAVLTVGAFHAGNAGNVIADSATLDGTIRTYDEEVRSKLKQRLQEISTGIAAAFRAEATVTFGSGCPTLHNDALLSNQVTGWLKELLGEHRVFTTAQLSGGKPSRGGGSEDFAYVSQEIPALMLAMTAGEPAKGHSFPQHHPQVTFDETVLSTGAAAFAHIAFSYFG